MIDGALVNPVPVSACRALGAHMVIAVSLNGDAFGPIGTSHEINFDEDEVDDTADPFELASQSLNKLRPDRLLIKCAMQHEIPLIKSVMDVLSQMPSSVSEPES